MGRPPSCECRCAAGQVSSSTSAGSVSVVSSITSETPDNCFGCSVQKPTFTWELAIAGLTNDNCTNCNNFNKVHKLYYDLRITSTVGSFSCLSKTWQNRFRCRWSNREELGCGTAPYYGTIMMEINDVSAGNTQAWLYFWNSAGTFENRYTKEIAGTFDCRNGSITFDRCATSFQNECDNWPSTLTAVVVATP